MKNSAIEWTHHTFNPWRGCAKVSEGCKNCYAETMSGRNPKTLGIWGPNGTRVVASEAMWREPLKWDEAAFEAGVRIRVFCASLADVFEEWQGPMIDSKGDRFCIYRPNGGVLATLPYAEDPPANCRWMNMDDVRALLFGLIRKTTNTDWLLLTKRPENAVAWFGRHYKRSDWHSLQRDGSYASTPRISNFLPQVWLGTSVENQATADERIPHLLKVPAAVRFLSMEPLLGEIDLYDAGAFRSEFGCEGASPDANCENCGHLLQGVDWVIVGGESGHNARPMHPAWARSIRDQCQTAGVPFFFKQWGEFAPETAGGMFAVGDKKSYRLDELGRLDKPNGGITIGVRRVGKKDAGRLLDGREWSEFPKAVPA